MSPIERRYSNTEIEVVWKPALCIHCRECIVGLPKVFDMEARPWVNMRGGTTEEIIQQVEKCPSGALSYHREES